MHHTTYIKDNIASREKRLSEIDVEDRDIVARRERLAQEKLTVGAELGVFRDMLAKFEGSTELVSPPPLAKPEKARAPTPSSFTISPTWIAVFEKLDARGRSFDAAEVERAGHTIGVKLTMPSIRSQFAHYTERGYLRKVARGKYNITPKGREKFAEAHQAHKSGEGQKENGLPLGSPETGVNAPIFNTIFGFGGKENA